MANQVWFLILLLCKIFDISGSVHTHIIQHGFTALMIAVKNKHWEIVDMLTKVNINLNIQEQVSCFFYPCIRGTWAGIKAIFLESIDILAPKTSNNVVHLQTVGYYY